MSDLPIPNSSAYLMLRVEITCSLAEWTRALQMKRPIAPPLHERLVPKKWAQGDLFEKLKARDSRAWIEFLTLVGSLCVQGLINEVHFDTLHDLALGKEAGEDRPHEHVD